MRRATQAGASSEVGETAEHEEQSLNVAEDRKVVSLPRRRKAGEVASAHEEVGERTVVEQQQEQEQKVEGEADCQILAVR